MNGSRLQTHRQMSCPAWPFGLHLRYVALFAPTRDRLPLGLKFRFLQTPNLFSFLPLGSVHTLLSGRSSVSFDFSGRSPSGFTTSRDSDPGLSLHYYLILSLSRPISSPRTEFNGRSPSRSSHSGLFGAAPEALRGGPGA